MCILRITPHSSTKLEVGVHTWDCRLREAEAGEWQLQACLGRRGHVPTYNMSEEPGLPPGVRPNFPDRGQSSQGNSMFISILGIWGFFKG